jgi:hypothetical protein
MALVINDRVKETSATTGTGAMTFAGATSGFETFQAGIGNSSTTYYAIVNTDTPTEWEVGLGTLAADSSTITRTTPISSSNSDAAVSFTSGTKEIFCTLPASKAVIKDASGVTTFAAAPIMDAGATVKNAATSAGFIEFYEDSDNGTNKVTFIGPSATADITITLPTQAGTVVVSNTTDGNDVQLDSLGLDTAASGTAGELRAANDVTAFYSSDIALKENIVKIPSPMEMVKKINGYFFDWKDSFIKSKGGEDGYFVRKKDVGILAQDVEKVLPEVVATRQDGIKAVKYDRLVSLLIECVKDLQGQVDKLKGK